MRDTIHMLHRLEHRVSMLQTLSTENEEKKGGEGDDNGDERDRRLGLMSVRRAVSGEIEPQYLNADTSRSRDAPASRDTAN